MAWTEHRNKSARIIRETYQVYTYLRSGMPIGNAIDFRTYSIGYWKARTYRSYEIVPERGNEKRLYRLKYHRFLCICILRLNYIVPENERPPAELVLDKMF